MTNKKHLISITSSPLLVPEALAFVSDPAHGAVDLFIGCVRDHNLGRKVLGISYEVYDPLATKILNDLCEQAQLQANNKLKIYIAHFQGKLDIQGISLIIAVSSPHRKEAFQACRFLIEEIKHKCPIWKQEHYVDGNSEWVKGHALCAHND